MAGALYLPQWKVIGRRYGKPGSAIMTRTDKNQPFGPFAFQELPGTRNLPRAVTELEGKLAENTSEFLEGGTGVFGAHPSRLELSRTDNPKSR